LTTSIYSQYDYGLDICDKDAKIEGKLNLSVDTNSVVIGFNAGINIDESTIGENTFIGYRSGRSNTTGVRNNLFGFDSGHNLLTGSENVLVGHKSGYMLATGWNNTFLGNLSGYRVASGFNNVLLGNNAGGGIQSGGNNTIVGTSAGTSTSIGGNNVFIGFTSGQTNDGSNNIFIGYQSGRNEQGSNKLVVENSNSTSPLIYGEFDNDIVQINGSLNISQFIRLVPTAAPASPEKGTMYYDSSDDKVKIWTGSAWENLFFTSSTQTETSFTENSESPCNTSCYDENLQLKARVVQLETKLKEYNSMQSKVEKMDKLLNQLLQETGIESRKTEINQSAKLEQNVPNPFKGTTKIHYLVPSNSQSARIKIYDITGQIIENINIENFGRGEIDVQVNKLSNGIYHYSLEVDGKIIDTKKMSSLK